MMTRDDVLVMIGIAAFSVIVGILAVLVLNAFR
jgi:hypothetical protein